MSSFQINSNNRATVFSVTAVAAAGGIAAWLLFVRREVRRHERSKWMEDKETKDKLAKDTLRSIFEDFTDTKLHAESTISEANKKRTQVYYERARDAHKYDLCPGVRSYPRLRNRREAEVKRIMRYQIVPTKNKNPAPEQKSHRTVITMCDHATAELLDQARKEILQPLAYSTDITTDAVWIPEQSIIPKPDMHVTVATLWWWHTIRESNRHLSRELVGRLRQALVSEFHFAFQIELERIVLLGGCALVALWRCIGQRQTAPTDGDEGGTIFTIFDRHGEEVDPFVKLRRDIVRFITDPDPGMKLEPLTYQQRKKQQQQQQQGQAATMQRNETPLLNAPPVSPPPPPMPTKGQGNERNNTIEFKTPGVAGQDGFIHTTLARLPLDCLSMTDTELAPIHRLCREATATYCGHRMVISDFRILETTGAGGESNPCVDPIFDETIQAPIRVSSEVYSGNKNVVTVIESTDLHAIRKEVEQHATIGALPPAVVPLRGDAGVALDDLFVELPAVKVKST